MNGWGKILAILIGGVIAGALGLLSFLLVHGSPQ